jgi:two-component system chemotaxis response regulator CheB
VSKRVLIVDDSALVRKQLRELIETLDFEIDMAKNGREAVDKALANNYDVITMDINMPVLDGLSAVEAIMKENPTPILMISSLTTESASTTMEALELGAVDYIGKPGTMNIGKEENSEDIVRKVRSLSRIPKRRLKAGSRRPVVRERTQPKVQENSELGDSRDIKKIVLIGASTGGPGLVEQICASLPAKYPYPFCIVQHMP